MISARNGTKRSAATGIVGSAGGPSRGGGAGLGDRLASPKSRKATLLAPAPIRRGDGMTLKRPAPVHKIPKEPPAKRVLFSKGPAFRATVEDPGVPGGVLYETSQMDEDQPERVITAASKALGEKIVTEAQKDTAMLLQLFAEGAAEALAKAGPTESKAGIETGGDNGVGRQHANENVQSNGSNGQDTNSKEDKKAGKENNLVVKKEDVKSDVLSLLCEENCFDGSGGSEDENEGLERERRWLGDSEKKVLEQCARTLYVISSGPSRGNGVGGATGGATSMKRRKADAPLNTKAACNQIPM